MALFKTFIVMVIPGFCASAIFDKLQNLQFTKCRLPESDMITSVNFDITLLDCIYKCNKIQTCKSFLYHATMHVCAFYTSEDLDTEDCDHQPVWYGLVEDYPRIVCGNDVSFRVCTLSECPKTIVDANAMTILGNMDTEGKTRRLLNHNNRNTQVEKCSDRNWVTVPDTSQSLRSQIVLVDTSQLTLYQNQMFGQSGNNGALTSSNDS